MRFVAQGTRGVRSSPNKQTQASLNLPWSGIRVEADTTYICDAHPDEANTSNSISTCARIHKRPIGNSSCVKT
eukprot:10706653-Alexandrium_andersonii.AAC.1